MSRKTFSGATSSSLMVCRQASLLTLCGITRSTSSSVSPASATAWWITSAIRLPYCSPNCVFCSAVSSSNSA
ncbi:hypothetical protein [Streptomyces narbonensis]